MDGGLSFRRVYKREAARTVSIKGKGNAYFKQADSTAAIRSYSLGPIVVPPLSAPLQG